MSWWLSDPGPWESQGLTTISAWTFLMQPGCKQLFNVVPTIPKKNSVLRKMVQFQLSSAVSIALRTMIPLKSFELPHGRIPASGYVVRTYLIDVQKSVRVMRQDDVIMTPCRMISDWDDLIMFSV